MTSKIWSSRWIGTAVRPYNSTEYLRDEKLFSSIWRCVQLKLQTNQSTNTYDEDVTSDRQNFCMYTDILTGHKCNEHLLSTIQLRSWQIIAIPQKAGLYWNDGQQQPLKASPLCSVKRHVTNGQMTKRALFQSFQNKTTVPALTVDIRVHWILYESLICHGQHE